jgi:hypothetical protein
MNLKESIATHLGWDVADVEYYQRPVWNMPIVTTSDEWFTATKSDKAPVAKNRDGLILNDWVLAEQFGEIRIWKRSVTQ